MGLPVLILGESGSGKTTSLRSFQKDEVGIISVVGKPLPFRTALKPYKLNTEAKRKGCDRYALLKKVLAAGSVRTFVIDDSQYLMSFDSFDLAHVKGYDKFTELAVNFKSLLDFIIDDLPDDKTVYLLHHTETTDTGKIKVKTIGKMLDQQLSVEGLFTIVLLCQNVKGEHQFITRSDGTSTVKSPIGMFADAAIDNDLKVVDETIRKYYGIGE